MRRRTAPPAGARSGKWLVACLWILAAASTARLVRFAVHAAEERRGGFAAYFTSSRLAREGKFDARVYDDRHFGDQVEEDAPGVRDIFRPNTPAMPLLLLPFGTWSYLGARRAATIVSLGAYAAAVALLAGRLGKAGRPLLVAVSAAWPPVLANFQFMQAYAFLLLPTALFVRALETRKDAAAGALLGFLTTLKLAVPHLWLVGLGSRRLGLLLSGCGAGLALALLSLAWSPWSAWVAWPRGVAGVLARPEIAVTAYQSQTSLLRRLAVDSPAVGSALIVALALGLAGLVLFLAAHDEGGALAVAGAVAASLATGLSLDYHYTLALLPLALLFSDVTRTKDRVDAAFLVLAALLMALPAGRPAAGALATLLAYPKVYGAWILVGLTMRAVRRRDSAGSAADRTRSGSEGPAAWPAS